MRAFLIFLHLLGGVLWIGGGLAAMFVSLAARKMGRPEQGIAARLVAAVYARMVAPGAGLIVFSGLLLALSGMNPSPWIMAMQGLGLLGAAIIFAIALPAVNRLARLDPVAQAEVFDGLRTRQRMAGMVATTCAFVSLLAGAMYR